jgi:hypothetical protein
MIPQNRHESLGGIAAILVVVGVKGCVLGTGVNLAAFSRSLRDSVLPPWGTDTEVAIEATKAIGMLSAREMPPQMSLQFVMAHAESALECLEHSSDKDELKRHAATMMLDEMVVARPNEFWKLIPRVFECIFKVCTYPFPWRKLSAFSATAPSITRLNSSSTACSLTCAGSFPHGH